jgi:hypothetical protein
VIPAILDLKRARAKRLAGPSIPWRMTFYYHNRTENTLKLESLLLNRLGLPPARQTNRREQAGDNSVANACPSKLVNVPVNLGDALETSFCDLLSLKDVAHSLKLVVEEIEYARRLECAQPRLRRCDQKAGLV